MTNVNEVAKFYYACCAAVSVGMGHVGRMAAMTAKALTEQRFGDVDWQDVRDAQVRRSYDFMSVDQIAEDSGFPVQELIG